MLALWRRILGSQKPLISHNSIFSFELEVIPDNAEFLREGNGLTTIRGDIGQNVCLTIRENGSLKIIGNMGSGCKIFKEGNGTLTIEGAVANDLELTVYGQGGVTFTRYPPDEVIRSIKNRGAAQIICAGTTLALANQGYRRHNLGIPSGQPLQEPPQATARVLSQLSVTPPSTSPSKVIEPVDQYREETQEYIELCQTRKLETFAARISKLNLTKKEEPLFERFKDPIMMDYFDDTPVMYKEKFYNLSTLLELYKNKKTDPYSRDVLKLADISPARELANKFDKAVLRLNKQREEAKQITLEPPPMEEERQSASINI